MYRVFAGRTGLSAGLGMLSTALIKIAVFLVNSAVIEGVMTEDAILRAVKGGFTLGLDVMWVTSLTAIIFAQMFLPSEVCGSYSIQLPSRTLVIIFFLLV